MKTISRYIMTLALLLTAVGGAWAQTETLLTTITATGTEQASYSTANMATVSFSTTAQGSSQYLANWGWWGYGWIATVTAAEGYTITKCIFYDDANRTATDSEAPFVVETTEEDKTPRINGTPIDGGNMWSKGIKTIEVYGYVTPAAPTEPDVEVTTNAAEEGATFTEASFEMPTFDATAEYELVRDMGIQMTATMGDGTDGVRYRVKKAQQGGGYEPADLNMMQVLALVAVNDGIEQKALTLNQDYYCRIYKLDEQTLQPEGDGVTLYNFDFAPGLYALKAFAKVGSDYDGETAFSNTFKLFQGYEVTVPAGEYATYFKDEALYVENENAQLYTISSVTESEAVLSDAITVAPANTPLLVYNKSQTETLTFLLIPTTDKTPDNVTAATQFVGTLEATTIPASTTGADNYALNGYAFVWVKTAIEVGANKCWLHIASQPAAARAMTRSIVGGNGTTGIDAIENVTIDNEGWYDLQGRKLQSAPNRKGIYIHNGRKVVVH